MVNTPGTPAYDGNLPITDELERALDPILEQVRNHDISPAGVASAVEQLANATYDAVRLLEIEQRESQKGQHTLR